MIIDSQVHIWRADSPQRPWPADGAARAQLKQPLGYPQLVAMMEEAGVDRVVIVPPSWEGDRNDYALEAVARHPGRFAVMGRITLSDPACLALLPDWKAQPGMLGIRLTFVQPDERARLTDGSMQAFWAAAERHGLPVMLLAAGMAPALSRVAERHPGLKLIIDHMGLSSGTSREGRVPAAAAETATLARHPNVFVKLSSAPTYSHEDYPFRDMHEPMRRLFEAFGPRRCFWGTDLSHMLRKCDYRGGVTLFTQELPWLSAEDRRWVMGQAIADCLGWPVPG